jgi:Family of unknown function (DUF5522)/Cysteine-rich CWC
MKELICERCGIKFGCGANAGACWCKSVPVVKLEKGAFKDCLCEPCLRALAKVPEALAGEDFYYDDKGLMVFTSAYLLKRGYCCKSGCKHCPYAKTPH